MSTELLRVELTREEIEALHQLASACELTAEAASLLPDGREQAARDRLVFWRGIVVTLQDVIDANDERRAAVEETICLGVLGLGDES